MAFNSTSSRFRLARTFLRSFSRSWKTVVPTTTTTIAPSALEIKRRSRRIKLAAYSSMARVAGPRRAWARALLFKLHTRARHRNLINRSRRGRRSMTPSARSGDDDRVGKLRGLVPGGDAMDVCTLLQETAHYIHCLSTQVKVMKALSHHLSTN